MITMKRINCGTIKKIRVILRNSHKRSHVLNIEEKKLVLKVRNFFEKEKVASRCSEKNNVVKQTAECLHISESTVKRVTREAVSGKLKKPHQKTGRPSIHVDSFFLGVIRRKILDFYMKKTFPTLKNLLVNLREEVPDFPGMSRTTYFMKNVENNQFCI